MDLHKQAEELQKTAENLQKEIANQKTSLENFLAISNPTLLREMNSLLSKAANGEMSVEQIKDWCKKYEQK